MVGEGVAGISGMWVVDCSNYLYQRMAASEWAAQQALTQAPQGAEGFWRRLWWRLTGAARRSQAQRQAQRQAESAAALAEAETFRRGLLGEQALITFLAPRLDNRYLLLRNYTPPPPFRSGGDIDGALLGPQGVTVFEVKAWRGVFRCAGEEWLFLPRDRSAWEPARKNPTQQARFNADRVRGTLALAGLRDVPVQPVIVAADPRMRVEIAEKPAVAIYQPFKDPTWLDLSPQGKPYSYDELDRIYKALITPRATPARRAR